MKILEINKTDLENNIKIINDSEKETDIIAVVKANRDGIRYNKII